jgi:formate hydrogenlyase subunit 3/multisubunit Na+/H+ antiporter MnhD subunit
MDHIARVFLLFTALLWASAGFYARTYEEEKTQPRFFTFFLITMSGNFGLILAQDVVSFYLFFALMSFASYGLVVHDGSQEANYAGRIYLVLVVIGEVLLVSALLLIVSSTGNVTLHEAAVRVAGAPMRDVVVGLLLAGFGIKAGVLPLHVWLPLAHPVAPTPASAVLSGAMIKAGLLGWLRFLPLGAVALPGWGSLCIGMGITAAFFGVIVGLTQNNPKTVLAYSSISQMGFITVALGIGLAVPTAWPSVLTAVLLYALHHALAKGALFLGVGVAQDAGAVKWRRRALFVGLSLPILALAGAPLTSGAVAKLTLKTAIALAPFAWPEWLSVLLPVAAVGTTMLMGRFLMLLPVTPGESEALLMPGLWFPWAVLLAGVTALIWSFVADPTTAILKTLSSAAVWPVLVGILCTWAAWRGQLPPLRTNFLYIPAGDLLTGAEWLARRCHSWVRMCRATMITSWLVGRIPHYRFGAVVTATLLRTETQLQRWTNGGILFLLLLGLLLVALAAP